MGLLSTALLLEVYSQLFTRPPFPTNDFTGKTILVTGANVGLGKEATAHFVRLGAAKVIIAVRSIEKGEAAKREIETALGRPNIIEILELDLSKYSSVKNFAASLAQRYDRIDHAVMNASIATEDYETFEDNESTITVNVVSTTYLILLLLPILRTSATKYQTTPVISVVSSGVHAYTTFPERKTPSPFATLNDPKLAVMTDRYQVSKLLQVYAVREIAEKTAGDSPLVVLNCLNPGLAHTALTRNARGSTKVIMAVMRACLAWTSEEGSRTLVHAVSQGPESHGVYISGCLVENNNLDSAVTNEDGQKTQKKVWSELSDKLEKIHPGVTKVLSN